VRLVLWHGTRSDNAARSDQTDLALNGGVRGRQAQARAATGGMRAIGEVGTAPKAPNAPGARRVQKKRARPALCLKLSELTFCTAGTY
jgi:hypothetical protein